MIAVHLTGTRGCKTIWAVTIDGQPQPWWVEIVGRNKRTALQLAKAKAGAYQASRPAKRLPKSLCHEQ